MYYPSSENKGADQLRGSGSASLFSPMQIAGFPMGWLKFCARTKVYCTIPADICPSPLSDLEMLKHLSKHLIDYDENFNS